MIAKGIIIAGTQSSSGKTAVVALLLAAFRQHGIPVQPFKVGPDFIDPGYHQIYAGTTSVNLDAWIMGEAEVRNAAERFTRNAVGVVEGVMGLFDGANPDNDEGSTIEIARWLGWPLVVVVPCAHAGRSLVASIRGFLHEAGPERCLGVILNQASSEGHATYLRKACASLEVPLLGIVPKLPELDWPERHLGLQASTERELPEPEVLAELAGRHLEVEPILEAVNPPAEKRQPLAEVRQPEGVRKRIGVAQDAAFHFYYRANLEWLREQGAEVVPFSPLNDSALPEKLDGLVLGGGFPEVFAEQVSANGALLKSLHKVVASGMPCYAECGGLMLLAESLETKEGCRFPMAGVVPGTVRMTDRLQNFGYCRGLAEGTPEARGHEFHHSEWVEEPELANLWTVTRHSTGISRHEGFGTETLHASYVHLHFPQAAPLVRRVLRL
jgi:cobyrinic acid a,c-diamide synthase